MTVSLIELASVEEHIALQGLLLEHQTNSRIRSSPSVWMAVILIIAYALFGIAGGDILSLNYEAAFPLVQVNEAVWHGAVWMLFTAMFLHANPSHLAGNILFLLIFGTSLEEQVRTRKWLVTYFMSGIVGNTTFLFLGGDAIGVGASGAIWGLLAAAGGIRGLVGMMFYLGLNIFAGGGFLAHAGGLVAGLALRRFWLSD
jgi:membrane associated rhomboid family serine protease